MTQLRRMAVLTSLFLLLIYVVPVGCGKPTTKEAIPMKTDQPFFLGPRTVVYFVEDLEKATAWYTKVLGFGPYFKEDYYVGFNVEGFELGLMPGKTPPEPSESMSISYWGVKDIEEAFAELKSAGATTRTEIEDVGVKVATLIDPFGNVIGVLEHPAFPNRMKPLQGVDSGRDGAANPND